jgi:hypothetical protein
MIELGCRDCEIGGGPAQAKGVAGGQGRISVRNQAPTRAGRQFGERCPHPSRCGRTSEDVEGLTEIVTTFIGFGGLQRAQLPDAVRVAEQGL